MLCENKLTKLVFKNQENSAKHNLLPFSSFFLIKKKKNKPGMKCMNVMQCKSQKKIKQKPKNNGHRKYNNEA